MDWAASSQAGEEEDILPNGTEPTPAPPSFDEPIPSVEVGSHSTPTTALSWLQQQTHCMMCQYFQVW